MEEGGKGGKGLVVFGLVLVWIGVVIGVKICRGFGYGRIPMEVKCS